MEWIQIVVFAIGLPMVVLITALWNGVKEENDRKMMKDLISAIKERDKR